MGEVVPFARPAATSCQTVIGIDMASGPDKTGFAFLEQEAGGYLKSLPLANLTPSQKRELALLKASSRASASDAAGILQAKADQLVLRAPPASTLPPVEGYTASRGVARPPVCLETGSFCADKKPVNLLPWLLLLAVVAWAIHITPAQWFGL